MIVKVIKLSNGGAVCYKKKNYDTIYRYVIVKVIKLFIGGAVCML